MLDVFDHVTVLIPTHNRLHLLKRNLDWLKSSECRIVVADSSISSAGDFFEDLNSTVFENRILYLHSSNEDYYQKVVEALRLINTPYVVMCPDDDFIIWKNLKYLVDVARSTNAKTVIARELALNSSGSCYELAETSEYRKYCLKYQDDFLKHLYAGMNPMVCTFYQLHDTKMLQHLYEYMERHKEIMPGNKLAEILFRSGCFINGPVSFCDKIFRIVGEEPSLRDHDHSSAIRKYKLGFLNEIKLVKQRGQLSQFKQALSSYICLFQPDYLHQAPAIVERFIWGPAIRRIHVKQETLWKSRYSLKFDFQKKGDSVLGGFDLISFKFGLFNADYRYPEVFSNFESYFLKDESEWTNVVDFLAFLNRNSRA